MKNIFNLAAFLVIVLSSANATAQENTDAGNSAAAIVGDDSRCFYSSKSFALGSPILIGEAIFVCTMEDNRPRWAENEQIKTANCLFASEYYAPGSIKAGVQCSSDGTWKKINQ